jgi:hypothetical protein
MITSESGGLNLRVASCGSCGSARAAVRFATRLVAFPRLSFRENPCVPTGAHPGHQSVQSTAVPVPIVGFSVQMQSIRGFTRLHWPIVAVEHSSRSRVSTVHPPPSQSEGREQGLPPSVVGQTQYVAIVPSWIVPPAAWHRSRDTPESWRSPAGHDSGNGDGSVTPHAI